MAGQNDRVSNGHEKLEGLRQKPANDILIKRWVFYFYV